jgi:nucleotide-binding universal stress UspA family protein
MYKHILIPTDGSERSEKAIQSGVELAKALGARVTGLYVIVDTLVAAGIGKSLHGHDEAVKMAESFLGVISREARQAGVPHECFHAVHQTPYEEIIKVATTRNCDLIFMSSHGRRGIAGLLLGSQTMHVLTHCKIPVLVYR